MPSTFRLYDKSSEAWEAMLADCATARNSIEFEQFIFVDDEIGRRFLRCFAEKAAAGVKVRLLLDGAGSMDFFSSERPQELAAAGIGVRCFNPISAWRIHNATSWYFRDHRKMMIIDGEIGHIGGVCIGADMADWQDAHLRLIDPVVTDMRHDFERMWRGFPPNSAGPAREPAQFLTSAPRFRKRQLYHHLLYRFRSARRSIRITTPYFIPSLRIERVLRAQARRGIEVSVIVPKASDHPMTDLASHWYYDRLLQDGVRIFHFPQEMIHAKTAVIDDAWGTVGSANLDNLSLLFNYEGSVGITDPGVVAGLIRRFERNRAASMEVRLKDWRRRSVWDKAAEKLSWPLHRFL